jgi:hypothetical protein
MSRRTDVTTDAKFTVWRRVHLLELWRQFAEFDAESDADRFVAGQQAAGDRSAFCVKPAGDVPAAAMGDGSRGGTPCDFGEPAPRSSKSVINLRRKGACRR